MAKTVIVKVQIPIYSTEPVAMCMVYPKERTPTAMQKISQDTFNALNDDLKGYFEATFSEERNCFDIGKRVADQPW